MEHILEAIFRFILVWLLLEPAVVLGLCSGLAAGAGVAWIGYPAVAPYAAISALIFYTPLAIWRFSHSQRKSGKPGDN